jgi:hypothetical protein
MKKKVLSILFDYADASGMNEYKMWLTVGEQNYMGKVKTIEEQIIFPAEYCTTVQYLITFEGGKSMRVKNPDIVHYSEENA